MAEGIISRFREAAPNCRSGSSREPVREIHRFNAGEHLPERSYLVRVVTARQDPIHSREGDRQL